jgi:alginate O-acetyltransferase complex protein AlgJ
MLLRHRRYFAALSMVLLATPLVWGIARPDSPELIYKEGRRLAPAPAAPDALEDWAVLPGQVDAYLKDHFGLRHTMIQLHKDLTKPMLGFGGSDVLVGRDGRMFYLGGQAVRQSAGLVLRDQKLADSANAIARMHDALKKRGIGFLVTVPPSASSIYQDDLPIWAQRRGKTTEYDLFLQDLAARGIKTVDLRPALAAVRSEGKVYLLHDSHWTPRGAIAGFDAIVEADSHPDWSVDPAAALGPPAVRKGGDLARMLGEQDEVTETVEPFALTPVAKDEKLAQDVMPAHAVTTGKPGPTVLVIGDSFTASYFPAMLAPHVSRAIWVHYSYSGCGFDWTMIDRFHPDEVWWVPVERAIICDAGPQSASRGELR